MARHQLGKELDDSEVKVLVAFLKSLTGEIPMDYIKKPDLPPSSPTTPKADPT
jgi:cytochrome c peroxidase